MLDELRAIVGERGLLTGSADTDAYCRDWRGLYHGRTPAVVRPGSAEEVAAVVRLCAQHRVALVPQGGNTSMVGGATPDESGAQLVLSLQRMRAIRALDPTDMTMEVEAGLPWAAARDAAAAQGCLLPLSISSEGTAQVGGILSANAGGNNTLRYGNARDLVLGLEAVLPDGQVWHGLRRLRKDNTGYALRQLLLGAEGTLGIITAAVLKLVPAPRETEVALCALPSLEAALRLFTRLHRQDPAALSAFEYMSGTGMGLVLTHIPGATLPLSEPAPHYALLELTSPRPGSGLRAVLEAVLEEALEAGDVLDAAMGESDAQRAALWRLREEHAEAQKREGASVKNDVSVPVSAVPEMVHRASEAVAALIPGTRPVPFGHMGDGNIHMNFAQPSGMPAAAFLDQADAIMHAVNDVVRDLGGSFSAEHGVGRLKPAMLAEWRGGAELDAMRRIKAALDPLGIMNPGKVLQTRN
jgi:FAD/FMN-containing dehydrogenase